MHKILLLATVLATACGLAQDESDPRVRSYVSPVRIVTQTEAVASATLLMPRHGQVPEGRFLAGSGCLLDAAKGSSLVLDFGREHHGGLVIGNGAAGRGAKVRVRFGESVAETMAELGEKGAQNDHALRDFVIELPWLGTREVGNSGFRFVRLDAVAGTPDLQSVRAVSLMRPMVRLGGFKSSDPRLNAVFNTAVRTVHLCCQDYLWDGIKRDRLVWMGDTHPETMAILPVFGAADVLPKSLDYMAATTPADAWMNTMPTYTLWWIRNLAEWYRYTGDLVYLKEHAAYLAATFDHVLSGMKDGQWTAGNFLDWPTEHDPIAATAGTQALALITARETAFLAEALGDATLKQKAENLAAQLAKLAPDPHGAKSAAALLALSGLRTPQAMYADVLSQNGHTGVSTFYGYYMLEAMSAAGEQKRALATARDYWGGMLDMGATSFWEDFNLAWTNNAFRVDQLPVPGKKDVHGDYGEFCYKGFRHSLCHGWAAGPAAWCINSVLGIRPVGVGAKQFEIAPDLGDLDWAEGAYALPDGRRLAVKVTRKDGKLDIAVQAPEDIVWKIR